MRPDNDDVRRSGALAVPSLADLRRPARPRLERSGRHLRVNAKTARPDEVRARPRSRDHLSADRRTRPVWLSLICADRGARLCPFPLIALTLMAMSESTKIGLIGGSGLGAALAQRTEGGARHE